VEHYFKDLVYKFVTLFFACLHFLLFCNT